MVLSPDEPAAIKGKRWLLTLLQRQSRLTWFGIPAALRWKRRAKRQVR